MSILDIFTKTTKVCPKKLEEAILTSIETPKQLDRIEENLKKLEARLLQELKNGGCKVAS